MEKKEILKQVDSQLWPLPEILYSEAGQYYWYDLNPKDIDTESLAVIWGGQESLKPGTKLKRQSYPYCCISYILKGHGTFKIHGQTHKLQPGVLSGHCPGAPHCLSVDTENPAEHIFIVFRGTEALELMERSSIAKLGAISVAHSEDIRRFMLYILKHSIDKTENSQRMCSSYLRIILLSLADHTTQSGKHTSKGESTYRQCRKFIDDNFITLSSTRDLSRQCGWNVDYITRLFKRFEGITPSQYLMRLKLSRAATFLLESDSTITEVASRLGFSDHYYFSKKFKSFHGFSPNQYRKAHLQR